MAVTPITPTEVAHQYLENIPDMVIEAVNTLIVKNWKHTRATVKQSDIVELAETLMGIEHKEFNNNWLDFEDLFRRSGWVVVYDKAHYTDSYDSSFTFAKK